MYGNVHVRTIRADATNLIHTHMYLQYARERAGAHAVENAVYDVLGPLPLLIADVRGVGHFEEVGGYQPMDL